MQPRILIQLDSDPQPSVFDAVVAIDSDVEQLLQYGQVEPTNTLPLVHGAMFTRGPNQLHNTAIFIGGSSVNVGEAIAKEVRQAFFGPVRVSLMIDCNGCNTTAAAAVLSAARHVEMSRLDALVLGGTGPVGQRVARLLLGHGGRVRLASRTLERAESAIERILDKAAQGSRDRIEPVGLDRETMLSEQLAAANCVFGCGAAGATLLDQSAIDSAKNLQVAIDLNAVPPAGLGGISPTDKATERSGRLDYGAIGVGGLKMKIHREAIRTLFTRNDLVLDAEEIFSIGRELELASTV